VLRPGMRADLNVIDMDKLKIKAPYWANDLPTNAGRWLQHVEGYRATVLRGVVTFENDKHSGQFPGRLVRNPRRVGLSDIHTNSQPACNVDTKDNAVDLTKYAVELSRDGGASAVARVLRDQDESSSKAVRSRL